MYPHTNVIMLQARPSQRVCLHGEDPTLATNSSHRTMVLLRLCHASPALSTIFAVRVLRFGTCGGGITEGPLSKPHSVMAQALVVVQMRETAATCPIFLKPLVSMLPSRHLTTNGKSSPARDMQKRGVENPDQEMAFQMGTAVLGLTARNQEASEVWPPLCRLSSSVILSRCSSKREGRYDTRSMHESAPTTRQSIPGSCLSLHGGRCNDVGGGKEKRER